MIEILFIFQVLDSVFSRRRSLTQIDEASARIPTRVSSDYRRSSAVAMLTASSAPKPAIRRLYERQLRDRTLPTTNSNNNLLIKAKALTVREDRESEGRSSTATSIQDSWSIRRSHTRTVPTFTMIYHRGTSALQYISVSSVCSSC